MYWYSSHTTVSISVAILPSSHWYSHEVVSIFPTVPAETSLVLSLTSSALHKNTWFFG
jgi:hypothetical protein